MKEIEGFNDYLVDIEGNVYSNKNNNFIKLKPIITKYGYCEVELYGNKRKRFKIHQLVALTFIPNPSNLPQVNHEDGNKKNNHVSNLKWCDSLYNLTHARETRLNTSIPPSNGKGEKNSRSILTENKVLEIREKASKGKTHKELSKEYGVATSTISGIVARIKWQHI